MALAAFESDMDELELLVGLVRVGSQNRRRLEASGVDVGVVALAAASCVVLACGRFEQFVKDVANKSLDQYGVAVPPVPRSALSDSIQVRILSENIRAAIRGKIYGIPVPHPTRIASIDRVSNLIADDAVWGDDAINTNSNPNSETVRSVLEFLSGENPWPSLEAGFEARWTTVRSASMVKEVPSCRNELDNIIRWRNSIAHTNNAANLGVVELDDMLQFFRSLGATLDEYVENSTATKIVDAGSVPKPW